MSEPVYRIKPLEWRRVTSTACDEISDTIIGRYDVRRSVKSGWRLIFWSDDDRSDFDKPCDSIESGKAAAERHWQERIKQALVEVTGD